MEIKVKHLFVVLYVLFSIYSGYILINDVILPGKQKLSELQTFYLIISIINIMIILFIFMLHFEEIIDFFKFKHLSNKTIFKFRDFKNNN